VNFYDSFNLHGTFQNITVNSYLNNIKATNKTVYEILNKLVEEIKNSSTLLSHNLDLSNEIYNYLNGITTKTTTHRVQYELFRAPVPFPMQELVDTIAEVKKALSWKAGKKIEILLVDNRTDKYKKDAVTTILEVLKKFNIDSLFKIRMIGGSEHDVNFCEDFEKFSLAKFKSDNKLNSEEIKYYGANIKGDTKISDTYNDLVYQKIKHFHFTFLDFFLNENEEDTYLAYDFIKDISEIKQSKGDYFTTWYFITSAVYDSVVKYSQSGLLAEYYELAVVNAGDDPTNEKRHIIFVYKLLTFINARMKTFRTYKEAIENMMLNEVPKNYKEAHCCVYDPQGDKSRYSRTAGCFKECLKVECLKNMQTYIKRYRTEYENIWSLFYEDKHKKVQRDIVELLDDTITKFIWLPEADWRMIQYQIDFINTKLISIRKDGSIYRQFSCDFIRNKITKRSEIY